MVNTNIPTAQQTMRLLEKRGVTVDPVPLTEYDGRGITAAEISRVAGVDPAEASYLYQLKREEEEEILID